MSTNAFSHIRSAGIIFFISFSFKGQKSKYINGQVLIERGYYSREGHYEEIR